MIKILFRFLFLMFYVFSLGDSVARVTKLFGSAPEEQCLDIGCKAMKSVSYFSSCGQYIDCRGCSLGSHKPVRQICSEWKPLKFERILLANGFVMSKEQVSGDQFENIHAEWSDSKPIDLSKCQLESFDINSAYSAFSNGGYTGLYSTVAFHISIVANIPKGKKLPSIEFQIDLEDTMEEINIRGMNSRMRREKCQCPLHHSPVPFKVGQKEKRETILVSRSFSIPLDRSEVYRPSEFRVRAKCQKNKICDLGVYKICLRVSCSRMPESQLAQYMIVQNLLENPPKTLGEPEWEEEEEGMSKKESRIDTEDGESEEKLSTVRKSSTVPAETIHVSRRVPVDISRDLKLEQGIVLNKNSEVDGGDTSNHLIYLVSGLSFLVLVLLAFLALRR